MMDFVILKVNGCDLSSASQSVILDILQSAAEPIVVEVARQNCTDTMPSSSPIRNMDTKFNNQLSDSRMMNDNGTTNSKKIEAEYEEIEVVLRKSNSTDIFGLTLSYSSRTPSNSNDSLATNSLHGGGNSVDSDSYGGSVGCMMNTNGSGKSYWSSSNSSMCNPSNSGKCTQSNNSICPPSNSTKPKSDLLVYISGIEPDSIADKEPNIQIGDKIIMINDVLIYSKQQVIALFKQSTLQVKLLITRHCTPQKPTNQNQFPMHQPINNLDPVYEGEYSCVYDQPNSDDNEDSSLDGENYNLTNENSSPFLLAQTENHENTQNTTINKVQMDKEIISKMMKQLELEYKQLQTMLLSNDKVDTNDNVIQPLPPPALANQNNNSNTVNTNFNRTVPRMGTRLSDSSNNIINNNNTKANNSSYNLININSNNGHKLAILNVNSSMPATNDTNNKSANNEYNHLTDPTNMEDEYDVTYQHLQQKNEKPIENHYYDVYDPETNSNHSNPNNTDHKKLASQSEPVNSVTTLPPNPDNSSKNTSSEKMEWVIKKRSDGTRYITRRPVKKQGKSDKSRTNSSKTRFKSTSYSENPKSSHWINKLHDSTKTTKQTSLETTRNNNDKSYRHYQNHSQFSHQISNIF